MKLSTAKRNGLVMLFSLGLGCLSAWAIERHLTEKSKELESRTRVDQVIRLVAGRDLTRGTLINLSDLAKNEFPTHWVGVDAIALSEAHLVQGKQLNVDLKAGQLLMHVHLTERVQPAIATRLGPDKRAVTIPVDLMSSISGLLQPGDRVDLFVSFEYKGQRSTAALLEGVEVLATGQQTRSTDDGIPGHAGHFATVTLATTHAQATKIVAARQGGTITAVLSHEMAESGAVRHQEVISDLPHLLGLETNKKAQAVEVIYGDRLTSEQNSSLSNDWAEPTETGSRRGGQ